jgi:6-phosphogluconolactonase
VGFQLKVACVLALASLASTAVARQYLYVNLYGSGIQAYSINDSTGALSAVTGAPFASAPGPTVMQATADGGVLYTLHIPAPPATTAQVSSWRIVPETGALTPVGGSPMALPLTGASSGISTGTIVPAPAGSLAYASLFPFTPSGIQLFGVRVDAASGNLQAVEGTPIAITHFGNAPAFGPGGKVLYVPWITPQGSYSVAGRINVYSVAANGVLSLTTTVPTGGYGPVRPQLSPSGTYLLVSQRSDGYSAAPATLATFTVDATTGALGSAPASVIPVGTPGALRQVGVTFHPSSNFAYLTMTDTSTPLPLISRIAAFQVDVNTGVATPIPGSPLDTDGTGAAPGSVDPSGKFLYVPNFGSSTIQVYTIDQTTGALTKVPGAPFTAGAGARMLAFDRSGKFLYSLDATAGTVSSFSIDPTTGALTFIRATSTGDGPSSMALVAFD